MLAGSLPKDAIFMGADMADQSDNRIPPSDGADWAFLALTPILLAATMLAAAAAFAGAESETPVALADQVQVVQVETAPLQN